jgi:hypothetical protein
MCRCSGASTGTAYTPNDPYDYDEISEHQLIDAKVNGETRKMVVHGARNGFYYVPMADDARKILQSVRGVTTTPSAINCTTEFGIDGAKPGGCQSPPNQRQILALTSRRASAGYKMGHQSPIRERRPGSSWCFCGAPHFERSEEKQAPMDMVDHARRGLPERRRPERVKLEKLTALR